jgi:DNA-binding response OmpR family regulator
MDRIAVVEDHPRVCELVRRALADAAIESDAFGNIESAWQAIRATPYGVVVVDRGLPDGDGLDLVRRMRSHQLAIPCLMLTARDALHDRIEGLESGADDYLVKPFPMSEMVARVRALLRRSPVLHPATPSFGDVVVHPEAGRIDCAGVSAALGTAELQILLSLVKAGGTVVRRASLETAAWGAGQTVTPAALDVALHRLRKKLKSIGSMLTITNVRGSGYGLH